MNAPTRIDTTRTVRAPRGSELSCKSWLSEAPFRMIQNNLDPAVADQLIREQPNRPDGWLMRANIQYRQPRAGLDVTADELDARFGKNPQVAKLILEIRASVALRKHTGIDARPGAP